MWPLLLLIRSTTVVHMLVKGTRSQKYSTPSNTVVNKVFDNGLFSVSFLACNFTRKYIIVVLVYNNYGIAIIFWCSFYFSDIAKFSQY